MATKCPWFAHNADPDPKALGLGKNQPGTCRRCLLRYRVASVSPYRLEKLTTESAVTIKAIAIHGGTPATARRYGKLLADERVHAALVELGIHDRED